MRNYAGYLDSPVSPYGGALIDDRYRRSLPVNRFSTPDQIQGQEFDVLNNYYNGNLETQMRDRLSNQRKTITDLINSSSAKDQALLDSIMGSLDTQRGAYHDEFGNLIHGQDAALRTNRTNYANTANARLAKSEADQAAELLDLTAAENAGEAAAIAEGTRGQKAMFSQSGAGPSSYATRLGIGLRTKTAADKLARISAIKRANRLALEQQHQALDSTLSAQERADLGAISGLNFNLLDTTAGQQRSDTGLKLTNQSALNQRTANQLLGLETDLANQDRQDANYLLGNQTNLLGTRQVKLPKISNTPDFNFGNLNVAGVSKSPLGKFKFTL